jgi:biotin carboxyl carrier protein
MKTHLVRVPSAADAPVTDVLVEPLESGRYRVQVGEQTLEVEAWAIEGGVALRHGQQTRDVLVDPRPDRDVVAIDGQRVDVTLQSARVYQLQQALGVGAAGAGRELVSPMTGKVVLVAVAPGDTAEEGRTLVIVEAMKMENELRAAADVVVGEVHVAPGDLVNPGDVLVTFAAPDDATEG